MSTAVFGMVRSAGNKILAAWNPYNPAAYIRAKSRGWKTVELSALEHPNVIERAPIIPAAISHAAIDASGTGQDRIIAAPTWGMNIDDLAHEYIDAKRDLKKANRLGRSPDNAVGHRAAPTES